MLRLNLKIWKNVHLIDFEIISNTSIYNIRVDPYILYYLKHKITWWKENEYNYLLYNFDATHEQSLKYLIQ